MRYDVVGGLTRHSQALHEIVQDFETSYSDVDLVCFNEEKPGLLTIKVCIHEYFPVIKSQNLHLTVC